MNSKVNWGAIFAGSFIGVAAMVFFSLFALAVGIGSLGIFTPVDATIFDSSISVPAAIYSIVTAAFSFALGGYCTVALAGPRSQGSACLHALTSFALPGTVLPILALSYLPAPGFFLTTGLAWTLFLAYGASCVSASTGGVLASLRRHRAPVVTSSERVVETREGWPAA